MSFRNAKIFRKCFSLRALYFFVQENELSFEIILKYSVSQKSKSSKSINYLVDICQSPQGDQLHLIPITQLKQFPETTEFEGVIE
jgi:hypothetical protein